MKSLGRRLVIWGVGIFAIIVACGVFDWPLWFRIFLCFVWGWECPAIITWWDDSHAFVGRVYLVTAQGKVKRQVFLSQAEAIEWAMSEPFKTYAMLIITHPVKTTAQLKRTIESQWDYIDRDEYDEEIEEDQK